MRSGKKEKIESIKKLVNNDFMLPDDSKEWVQFVESTIIPGGYTGSDGKEYTLEEMRAMPYQIHLGFSIPGVDYKIVFK